MTLAAFTIFPAAFAIAAYAILTTIIPRLDRIMSALRGEIVPVLETVHAHL